MNGGLKRWFSLDRFGRKLEERLDDEVRFHLEARMEELQRAGKSPEEARMEALRRFGDPDAVREECRRIDEEGFRRGARREAFADFWQDVRFAMRSLGKSRGFTLVSVLSLAVGIGVFVAFFSMISETWLRPVPGVARDGRVVEVLNVQRGIESQSWSYPDFHDVRTTRTPLLALAGWKDREGTLTLEGNGERVRMMYVSADYFDVLGVVPSLGREFLPHEDAGPGQHPVAVVSHQMWQDRLGADPEVLGKTLTLNQAPFTVVGVAPEEFRGHLTLREPPEVWVPLMQDPWLGGEDSYRINRGARWLRILGRLREGTSIPEANAALQTVFFRLEEQHPETNEGRSARAHTFGPVPASGRTEAILIVALVSCLIGLVLFIICGNVAGMVLARVVTREQEIAVRLALGSGRGRLARLLMVEALILATAGGALGLLLGVWGLDLGYALLPGIPSVEVRTGGPVLAFALALTLGATLAIGLLPAVRFSRPDLISSLKDDTGGGGRRVGRIHRFSASAQTGVALALLVTCTLFVRAMGVMQERDLGFEPRGLLTTRIDLSDQGVESPEAGAAYLDRVTQTLEAVPGVSSVAVANGLPLDLVGNFTSVTRADLPEGEASRVQVEFTLASEGFFETIGTPLLRGRGFEVTDDPTSEPVIVVTESLAELLWPGEGALGRQVGLRLRSQGPERYTVVGVVGDVASSRPTETWPNVFLSLTQNYSPRTWVLVKSRRDAAELARPVQVALLDADPGLPFPAIVTSESLVARSTESHRIASLMAGGLGLLALILSGIGVYGVVAFSVSSRTREIGLRMAMGASRRRVLTGILKDAVRLSLPGLVLGGGAALGVAAASRSQLLGLNPLDPVSFAAGAGILFVIVLLASFVPARRASGIHPMRALRQD